MHPSLMPAFIKSKAYQNQLVTQRWVCGDGRASGPLVWLNSAFSEGV